MKVHPTIWNSLLAVILSLLCFGCRKDLCYHHDEHSIGVKVYADFTWEREWERPYDFQWKRDWPTDWELTYDELRPAAAKGVRTVVYTPQGGYAEGNLSAEGGRISLSEGTSSILFYNNDTEYLVFSNLGTGVTASATTRTVYRSSFKALHRDERTMNQPDMLYGHYEQEYVAERTLERVELPVKMKPLVYTYLIRYVFTRGLSYVALARGAIAGMAESVFLQDGHTGNQASTILYDAALKTYGAEARVLTFGVPNYPGDHYTRGDGTPARFALNLEVRLKNGQFKNFEFDITDQLLKQPRGGVIEVGGIEISEGEGNAGGSGFDVEVEGWGDCIDIPLPI